MISEQLQLIADQKMLLDIDCEKHTVMEWVERHRDEIDQHLSLNGALLLRGFQDLDAELFGTMLSTLFGTELSAYTYRSTPRTEIKGNIYTATEYHASETIPQHNEIAYSNVWPMRIAFLCITPAAKMGNTPISDTRLIYHQIPPEIREEFERKKIMYVRNYSKIDLPWQEVFQVDNKEAVEAYCKENDMKYEWTETGLRTTQVNPAVVMHPVTREKLWFNQAHLFHVSSLDPEIKEGLIELLGEANLPRNTYFGDGTPINEAVLNEIRKVYERTRFSFQWQKDDLLLLDNMLFTHGREPFEGNRKILVGMAREYRA